MSSIKSAATNATLSAYFNGRSEEAHTKSDVIIHGGSHSPYIYFIIAGYVKGYTISDKGDYYLSTIKGRADLLPLASLFDSQENPLYYEAMTDVVLRKATKKDFEAALSASGPLTLATLKKSAWVLRDYINRLHNLEISDARSRIIYRLLYLLDRYGLKSKQKREVILMPITHYDLADSLNLTRETVNRIVSQLADEKLVEKTRSCITITDRAKLEAEVSGYQTSTAITNRDLAHSSLANS